MSSTPVSAAALSDFLTHAEELVSVNHRFFKKRELSPVAHMRQREEAMATGLAALALCYGVTLEMPLQVDSRGEVRINVDQKASEGPINPFNQQRTYGQAFAELLNQFQPRTGINPPAILDPVNTWCIMNHFSVEKMVLAAADQFKRERLGGEQVKSGLEIVTVKGEIDTDEESQERFTPPGSVGVLNDLNAPCQWAVIFGDAVVSIPESEIFDPSKYRLRSEYLAEAKALLEDVGVTVAPDSDQPGMGVWYAPLDGCDVSFDTEASAVDNALAEAMEQSRRILDIPPEQWVQIPLDQKMSSMRSAMTDENPAAAER